jgi:prepilin-type N-terminal cleavage/methylation domain-containing protein
MVNRPSQLNTETRTKMMRKQKGFSLIELLIVVAIILIIAAIAIPNLLRARIAANESAAASGVRTINTGEISYANTYPTKGYSALLADLGPGGVAAACPAPPTQAASCNIDGVLAAGTKQGFTYTYAPGGQTPTVSYTIKNAPTQQNQTGVRGFCSFEDAVVRFQAVAPIGACDGTVNVLGQ